MEANLSTPAPSAKICAAVSRVTPTGGRQGRREMLHGGLHVRLELIDLDTQDAQVLDQTAGQSNSTRNLTATEIVKHPRRTPRTQHDSLTE